ncbi:MAG: GatB/YqeY domain-containing protein [Thermoflavifilum sp.]|nr:GatB/YqeY domain-containing protein [Thermoflavifilum sp.]MCL6514918.1 GatB/YqeY domain-containing protein [Alicyclobacillus sp.]
MTLSERLTEDLKQAMKAQDKVRLSVIRMVRAAMKNREIEKGGPLTDDDVIGVIQKELKQRQDSLQAFESAGRTDLADQTKAEMAVLQTYLPEALSPEELREMAERVIAEVGATGPRDIGKVMSALMPQVRGRADGRQVQQVVQSLLSSRG